MAGIMGVTAFLSMWISNSAATSIMLPVVLAITDEFTRFEREHAEKRGTVNRGFSAVNSNMCAHLE